MCNGKTEQNIPITNHLRRKHAKVRITIHGVCLGVCNECLPQLCYKPGPRKHIAISHKSPPANFSQGLPCQLCRPCLAVWPPVAVYSPLIRFVQPQTRGGVSPECGTDNIAAVRQLYNQGCAKYHFQHAELKVRTPLTAASLQSGNLVETLSADSGSKT